MHMLRMVGRAGLQCGSARAVGYLSAIILCSWPELVLAYVPAPGSTVGRRCTSSPKSPVLLVTSVGPLAAPQKVAAVQVGGTGAAAEAHDMRRKRLFVAIEIEDEAKSVLASCMITDIGQSPRSKGLEGLLRWERQDKLHITLKFLGTVSNEVCDMIFHVVMHCPPRATCAQYLFAFLCGWGSTG